MKFMIKPPIHVLSIIHLTTVYGRIFQSRVLNPEWDTISEGQPLSEIYPV